MFDYSYNFKLPCQECTAAEFEKLISSERVRNAIARARASEAAKNEAEKAKAKQSLPCLMFQATFRESENKYGKRARWRRNENVVLNGLFIVDIDHVEKPREEWLTIKEIATNGGFIDIFLLAFVTASGHGLKLVCKANSEIGDIAANQQWLCQRLCIQFDEACKDAARASFCPSKEDILYINNELFSYNNEEYEKTFGEFYRTGGKCSPSKVLKNEAVQTTVGNSVATDNAQKVTGETTTAPVPHPTFRGVPYARIVAEYERIKGGKAAEGERHHRALQMAIDFRHICDKDYAQLLWVLRQSETVKEIDGRKPGEIEAIAEGAVRLRNSSNYPDDIVKACANCGIQLEKKANDDDIQQDEIDYAYWWGRLRPMLHPELNADGVIRDPYAETVASLEDEIKLGGVLTAGCMLGTYLSKCYYQFYDAKLYRFSYLNYVVGPPASGKSYIIDLDRVLMYELKQQDEQWRAEEREYAEQKERNEQTKGTEQTNVKSKPHVPIRYVPSTISNHVLYNRLRDAVDPDDKMGPHLHLFTMESELATAMRAQVGSWAGKRDLELKSFQNECAGVDFANTGSANGLIQINWNQVISTVEDSLKKKFIPNINDGLITRIAMWVMPEREGEMIEYQGDKPVKIGVEELTEREMKTVELCRRLQKMSGIVPCEPLMRCAWEWCDEKCLEVKVLGDRLVEYFRKRIPHYMVRYTLPRVIAREYDSYMLTGYVNITDEDKAFARLIGDWLMYISVRTWGKALLDYWDNQPIEGMPKQRQRNSKFTEKFMALPEEFTLEQFGADYKTPKSAMSMINKLIRNKVLEKVGDNRWKKIVTDISQVVLA